MAQNFSLTRRKRPVASLWAMPTAAFSNVPRNRSSLARSASSVCRRSVMSVQVPNHLTMLPLLSRIGTPRLEPAVLPVAAAYPVFDVVGVAPRHGLQPEVPRRLAVLRVQRLEPAPAEQPRLRNAGVLRPLGAKIVAGTVGRRGPDELRQCLRQAAPALLTFAERLGFLRLPPLGHIAEDQNHARDA